MIVLSLKRAEVRAERDPHFGVSFSFAFVDNIRIRAGLRVRIQIGRRLKQLRIARKLSQVDIEKRTGLLRPYISRIEHGQSVPNLGNLAKYAKALEIPLYQIFYTEEPNGKPTLPPMNAQSYFGMTEKEQREMEAFAAALSKMNERDRNVLVGIAQKLAGRGFRRKKQNQRSGESTNGLPRLAGAC